MATPNVNSYNTYIGNGVATEFSIGFGYTSTDSVKVYIKRVGGEEALVNTADYSFVNETTLKFPAVGSSETILAEGDVLTIQRETPVQNDFVFSNQKRLFPEDVMEADDNEMRILQEHERQLGRALVLQPTSQADPEVVIGQVERVYESIDNVDAVADNIQNVNTVAEIAEEINTVADNTQNINAVAENEENISQVASDSTAINDCHDNMAAIQAAPSNATAAATSAEHAQIWAEGDDEDVEDLGGTHSSLASAGLSYAYANAPFGTPVEEFAANHDVVVNGEKGDPGPQGIPGEDGKDGADGKDGKDGADGADGAPGQDGAPGRDGVDGQDGQDGADATINGVNALLLNATDGLSGSQSGNTYTLSGAELQTSISGKEDKSTIVQLSATDSITLADNTIYDDGGLGLSSLTVSLPTGQTNKFLSEIDFSSPATATTLSYPNTIVWVEGSDDIQTVSNVKSFVPVASQRYVVMIGYNGTSFYGVAKRS